jgi:molybdopterin molybdotransferase
VIASGGISVGDYDFVGKAFRDLGVEEIFYKVKQKPGKPLFFAKKENTAVFALPGNPASALTGLYQYVLPSINKMSGHGFEGLKKANLPLIGGYSKKGTRAQFLKGFITSEGVEILEGQSSAMMHTYAVTNALIYIPWDQAETKDGEEVMVYLM